MQDKLRSKMCNLNLRRKHQTQIEKCSTKQPARNQCEKCQVQKVQEDWRRLTRMTLRGDWGLSQNRAKSSTADGAHVVRGERGRSGGVTTVYIFSLKAMLWSCSTGPITVGNTHLFRVMGHHGITYLSHGKRKSSLYYTCNCSLSVLYICFKNF